jgi:hypothetical protein
MKSTIGVYGTHDKAVAALQELKKSGYPDKQLSVVGKADLVDGHVQVRAGHEHEVSYSTIGIAGANVLETLAVLGIFLIPGFGFLFAAGAAVGGFAGLSAVLLAGGDVRAIFTDKDVNEQDAIRYEKRLIEGQFLVFADGDDEQLKQAHHILETQGTFLELN